MKSSNRKYEINEPKNIEKMLNRECIVLENGFRAISVKFYYCTTCDSEQTEPICVDCSNNCHKDHILSEIQNDVPEEEKIKVICLCGIRGHKLERNIHDEKYMKKCFFHELSTFSKLNIFYKKDEDSPICMFCNNFCYAKEESVKFKKIKEKDSKNVPECSCTEKSHNHKNDILYYFSKIQDSAKNFENLTSTQIFNILFSSDELIKNLLPNFDNSHTEIVKELALDNIELNSKIQFTDFATTIKVFAKIAFECKIKKKYLSLSVKKYFSLELLNSILKKKFDNDEVGIINFRSNLFDCVHKFYIDSDFAMVPKLKVFDFINMSPLQRSLIISNIRNVGNFSKTYLGENNNIIDNLLNSLLSFSRANFTKLAGYENLFRLTIIIKKFAKFGMITNKQKQEYCIYIEEIFAKMMSFKIKLNKEEKEQDKLIEHELKCLLGIVKTYIYFSLNYNDDIVLENLSGSSNDNYNFLHSKNNIGKHVSKNILQLVDYLRKVIENSKNSISEKSINTKTLEKITYFSNELISLYISNPDYYVVGLRRTIDKNSEIYIRFINNQFKPKELEIISYLQEQYSSMEKKIFEYYNYTLNFSDLLDFLFHSVDSLFEKINIDFKPPENVNLLTENAFNDNDKILQKSKSKLKVFSAPTSNIANQQIELQTNDNVDYKMIINKSYYIFSLTKIWSIYYNEPDAQRTKKLEDKLLDKVLKVLYFYVDQNPDNCILALSTEILNVFVDVDCRNSDKILEFIYFCLNILQKNNFEIASSSRWIEISYQILSKSLKKENEFECLKMFLKIVKLNLIDIPSLNHNSVIILIRQKLKFLSKDSEFFIDYRDNLLNKFSSKVEIEEKKNDSKRKPIDKADTKFICDLNLAEIIFTKFIKTINLSFDDNAMFNDNEFLSELLTKDQIMKILNNLSLDLSLRTEIIHYFRMVYMDVTIDKTKLQKYRTVFCMNDDIFLDRSLIKSDDTKTFQFLEKLLKIGGTEIHSEIEFKILLNELINHETIFEKNIDHPASGFINYLEDGIILPLKVYLKKIFSIIQEMSGSQILDIYKLAVNLLRFKLHLLKNPHIVNITTLYDQKELTEVEDNISILNEDKKVFKKLWKHQKQKSSLIKNKFTHEELELVKNDINRMLENTFQPFDYYQLYNIMARHFFNFIKKSKSKSLKELFVKNSKLDDEKINNLITKYKQEGFLTTEIDQKAFKLISIYQNYKEEIMNSSIAENLDENSLEQQVNYKNLLIRYCFKLSHQIGKNFDEDISKDGNKFLLKLLQNDTNAVQEEIKNLYEKDKSIINLEDLFDYFIQNLISVIFSSYNPSAIHFNEDYSNACIIIKIFKYLCEEHNSYFQTLLMTNLKFEIDEINEENRVNKVTFYDMILFINNKVLSLSGWENSKKEDDSVKYFYDLFSGLNELLIECVQGNSLENFQNLVNYQNNEIRALPLFLNTIKNLLFKDKSFSETVYKVRKQLCDYLLSFLEENKCPNDIKYFIIDAFYPQSILNSIINTLKKFYIRSFEEPNIEKSKKNKKNNDQELLEADFVDNIYLESEKNYSKTNFKNINLDSKMYKFFNNKYYEDEEFPLNPEFELANNLFKYIKLLAVEFKKNECIKFLDVINDPKKNLDNSVWSNFKNLFKIFKNHEYIDENSNNINDIETFYSMKFFENITRCVEVQKEKESKPNVVIYTMIPDIQYLSKTTKFDFVTNVDRHSRCVKLFSLVEYCAYFLEEIRYNKENAKNNIILKFSNKINFYYVEIFMFLICLTINIYMLSVLQLQDVLFDRQTHTFHKYLYKSPEETRLKPFDSNSVMNHDSIIRGISIFQVIINLIFFIIWTLSKLPLYIIIDMKKFCLKNNLKEEDMRWYHKYLFVGIYYSIYLRNEVMMLVWNTVFGLIGLLAQSNYIYSLQLLHILNLSPTLKNIIIAIKMRWNQLLFTFLLSFIILYTYSFFGFFFIHEEFAKVKLGSKEFPSGTEDICSSMVYCFLSHILYGLYRHGGIGDVLPRKSYLNDKAHYIKLVIYNLSFFLVFSLIMLNLVFGIIIDTFKALRIQETKNEDDIENVCFICGVKKEELEKNCKSFEEHTEIVHDIWNYAYYIIGLNFLDPQETNAIISLTIEKVKNRDISWMPVYKEDSEEENSDEEKKDEIKEGIHEMILPLEKLQSSKKKSNIEIKSQFKQDIRDKKISHKLNKLKLSEFKFENKIEINRMETNSEIRVSGDEVYSKI